MRPRIPLAYAGLLIVALVAVVGFAAFSTETGTSEATPTSTAEETIAPQAVSGRVASAILALRVSDADARLTDTTTGSPATTTSTSSTSPSSTSSAGVDTTAVDEPSPATTATTSPPKDTTPPDLRITSPSDGATVDERVVTFSGTSEAGATVYSGPYDANTDADGNWSIKLVVSTEGSNAKITAEDAAGNTVTKSILVTYRPETTTTTTNAPSTTQPPTQSSWSPLWPEDAAGKRHVEYWRPLVEKYWPDYLVNCALNIIHFESYGNPQAYNTSVKAEGLFQHLSKYWKARAAAAGFRDSNGLYATPYNAEANIAVSWYLAKNSDPWDRHWSVDPQHPNAPFECTE